MKSTHAQFYALLKQMPYAEKENLVRDASGGRTSSLSEFAESNPKGYNRMLSDMQRSINGQIETQKESDEIEAQKRRYRSLILGKFASHGIVVKNWDYTEINNIIQHWSKSLKTMKTMNLDELKKLNRQVHKIMEWLDNKGKDLKN
jgi:hypothetical protein